VSQVERVRLIPLGQPTRRLLLLQLLPLHLRLLRNLPSLPLTQGSGASARVVHLAGVRDRAGISEEAGVRDEAGVRGYASETSRQRSAVKDRSSATSCHH
jgi:hypothetical protein